MIALPTPQDRPWLSVAEVAEITHEGEKVIRAAIDAGQLPVIRIGRYVRVPTALLYELLGLQPPGMEAAAPPRTAAQVLTNAQLAHEPDLSIARHGGDGDEAA